MSEREIRQFLRQRFRGDPEGIDDQEMDEATVRAKLDEYFAELVPMGVQLDEPIRERITDEIADDILGLGPIEELLRDPDVTEVMINGPDEVFVEWQGRKARSEVTFDGDDHLHHTLEKLLISTGKRLDESSPYVDLSLPDGSRVNVIIPPVAVGGPHVTIRRYQHRFDSLENLVEMDTLDERMARFLLACVRARINVIFSGASGTGKTTMVEVLSTYIESNERVVVIEDTLELKLRQSNVVRLLTRPPNPDGRGEITTRDLFSNSLRMRPDRIILGELRGPEVLDYLQAINSGHRGSLGVIHASTPEEALLRLESLTAFTGIPIPAGVTRHQIAHGLDVVVQLAQLNDGSRKVTRIAEVIDSRDDSPLAALDLFVYRETGFDAEGRVEGFHAATGAVPSFLDLFARAGVPLGRDLFEGTAQESI